MPDSDREASTHEGTADSPLSVPTEFSFLFFTSTKGYGRDFLTKAKYSAVKDTFPLLFKDNPGRRRSRSAHSEEVLFSIILIPTDTPF